jgi:hypothetical protein
MLHEDTKGERRYTSTLSLTPTALPRVRLYTHCTGRRVGPKADREGREKSHHQRDSNLGLPGP